ncbi:UDP-N-acetylglucosamine 1-carboxyvinyltransferase [Dermatophilus congolensis]|uniref:UDP-N-acetylglucosamine 1-carboxyvinyltransferase n=1 Tax=Dermatophilus congolensis TaxID=1863 RepID=UPI001AAF56F8|nr:UDP-N-acetylglucosamine 1-carboxyvinyltransferase [Dermatophilus congolensis]MBO3142747.1 UDP-N-acetylglucosamine 1-carboxyvinyltransferase [Dermatophilus congolensis]MBO3151739.1 UDP-N-acetylglucosamine 1-carboxyvinyltransferase [Dermatophilus congolensis]MBO3161260.1 UDP-N-acetylglucosamine 1-carboxyvinyltransferase [Dermatophilus congolensis]MBO3163021.1 UDP-N-acetylglucosamine 1-carboxyvinyltransferase [Dermatophilus congolensis]MBO3176573.1 UDP-N-acetylglucosamine 1-carboxyvinyltransfe
MSENYLARIGDLVREARKERGLTQSDLAELLNTSQSAVARIEQGKQNLSLEMLSRLGQNLNSEFVSLGTTGPQHLKIDGGHKLSGSIDINTSKNAAVALLCASLINKGTTTLRRMARIEEVNRLIEVLTSIGVKCTWFEDSNDLQITPPATFDLSRLDAEAARRTRSIIMFFGPLMNQLDSFDLPYAGGCNLGARTIEPHMTALRAFGLEVEATTGLYRATVTPATPTGSIVLTERGDTVTENALMAAAMRETTTIIRNASPNYMVQDLCFYLEKLGVQIEGIGTTTLKVTGKSHIDVDVEYFPSEDPIEAMSLLAAAVVTDSEITIKRVPIEFMEIELAVLSEMGLKYELTEEYASANGRTRLVDLTTKPGELKAPIDKIHPMPFPGLNIDNLPFFALIGAVAEGRTMIHDWVYENRAIYLTELTRLNASVELLDPHRVAVQGPTRWRPAEVVCPPALRPAVVVLIAMLAAPGTSYLRNVYVINRGYQDLADRLNSLGANIEIFRDI